MAKPTVEVQNDLVSRLTSMGVSSATAQTVASSALIDKYGADTFRYIETNPSLLSNLPASVQLEVQQKLYDRVKPLAQKAINEGYIHPEVGNALLNSLEFASSTSERDAAWGRINSLAARYNNGDGARSNMRREAIQAQEDIGVLNRYRRDVLDPLANRAYDDGNAIKIEDGIVMVGNQPHYRVNLIATNKTGDPFVAQSTLVTAKRAGFYEDETGQRKEVVTGYADSKPILPTASLVQDENGRFNLKIGYNTFEKTDKGVQANVFKPFPDRLDTRAGHLGFQQAAAYSILGGGGHPGQTVVDRGGRLQIKPLTSLSASRMSYVQRGGDDVASPRNFGAYLPPAGESTQSKMVLHSDILVDPMWSATKLSQSQPVIDLEGIRRKLDQYQMTIDDVPSEVRPYVNRTNPVTGKPYNYLSNINSVTGDRFYTRNADLVVFKPIPDQPGQVAVMGETGTTLYGVKGVSDNKPQKGLKAWQLGSREFGSFLNRDTGEEFDRVRGPISTQGGQNLEGTILNAAFVLSGSQDSDGGALLARSLGIQRSFTMRVPDGIDPAEAQRLNTMVGRWTNHPAINEGTDRAMPIGSGFDSTYITGVDADTGTISGYQRGAPIDLDVSGEKAFGVYSDYVETYDDKKAGFRTDVVFNKVNDTAASMFSILNALKIVRPDEYSQLELAQFNSKVRQNYLRNNEQLTEDDIQAANTGRQTFDRSLMGSKSWNAESNDLFRSMYQDFVTANMRIEEHSRLVSQDILPAIAPNSMLRTQAEKDLQAQYFSGNTPLTTVTKVNYLPNHQARVWTNQHVLRTPIITDPEAKVSGNQGRISASDAISITYGHENDPAVVARLKAMGAEKAARRGSIIHSAAINEGANIGSFAEQQIGSDIQLNDALAFQKAFSSISDTDPYRLAKILSLYQRHALGGRDVPTLLHVQDIGGASARGYMMPQPSALTPLIAGSDDESAGPEVTAIIAALKQQVDQIVIAATRGQSTAIPAVIGNAATVGLSKLASLESTRRDFIGRQSNAALHLPVGGDPQLIAGVSALTDNQYKSDIMKNLAEQGISIDSDDATAFIDEMEKRFLEHMKQNGIISALDAGILPVAPIYRNPHDTTDQASFESLIRESFGKKIGILGLSLINNQLVNSFPSQFVQRGDYDKDTTTKGVLFISVKDGKLVSTTAPRSHADLLAAAYDVLDPAQQAKTWMEIAGTDYAGKSILGVAQNLTNKQAKPAKAEDILGQGTLNTTLAKVNVGRIDSMTLRMRNYWKFISDPQAHSAFEAAEIFRKYNKQLPLDLKDLDPGAAELLGLSQQTKLTKGGTISSLSPSSIVEAIAKSDPEHFGYGQQAELIVPTNTSNRVAIVAQVAELLSKKASAKEILGVVGSIEGSFAGYFIDNSLLNALTSKKRNGKVDFDLQKETTLLQRAAARRAASVNMMVGTGNVLGHGEMAAFDVVESLSLNPEVLPGAGNEMLAEAISRLSVNTETDNDPLIYQLERKTMQIGHAPVGSAWNHAAPTFPSGPSDGGVIGSGGSGDMGGPPDMPPFDMEPPDEEDDGQPNIPLPPNSKVNPPNLATQAQIPNAAYNRYHLNASQLTLQGVLQTLSGMSSPQSRETQMKTILSRVPFDIRKNTGDALSPYKWEAFGRTPGLGQRILHGLGVNASKDTVQQGQDNSLYYGGQDFHPGLPFTGQNGSTVYIHGEAPHVQDGMITGISFASAPQSAEDRKRYRMQQVAYGRGTGATQARTAFYDFGKFSQTFAHHFPGEDINKVLGSQQSYEDWANADKSRIPLLGHAYESAFTGFGETLDLADHQQEFDDEMNANMPIIDAFRASEQGLGNSDYSAQVAPGVLQTFPEVGGILSHNGSNSSTQAVNESLQGMGEMIGTMPDAEQQAALARLGAADSEDVPAFIRAATYQKAGKGSAAPTQVSIPTQVNAPASPFVVSKTASATLNAASSPPVAPSGSGMLYDPYGNPPPVAAPGVAPNPFVVSPTAAATLAGAPSVGMPSPSVASPSPFVVSPAAAATLAGAPAVGFPVSPPGISAAIARLSTPTPASPPPTPTPPIVKPSSSMYSDTYLKQSFHGGTLSSVHGITTNQADDTISNSMYLNQGFISGGMYAMGSSKDLLLEAQTLSYKTDLSENEANRLQDIYKGVGQLAKANYQAKTLVDMYNKDPDLVATNYGSPDDEYGEKQHAAAEAILAKTGGMFGYYTDPTTGKPTTPRVGTAILETNSFDTQFNIGQALHKDQKIPEFMDKPLDVAHAQAQIAAIPAMNADLAAAEEAFKKVGAAAKGAYDPTMDLVKGVKDQADVYSKLVSNFKEAEKVQDSNPVAKSFLAANASLWSGSAPQGELAEMGNRLLGTGGSGGLLQQALTKEYSNLGGEMPQEAEFRDKLAPFLQSGRAGREAKAVGTNKGWYGTDDQGKGEMSLGWKIGGTALGTLNNAVLGYRMFRNIAQETIAPFQEDQQVYQQSQTARAMAAMQSGMLNITQPGEQQLSYVRYANNTLQTQRNIGQSFQNAWMPLQSMLTGGAEGPNTATEAAAIGGPAIGAGVAASFATGNPLIGVAVGLGAAAIGEAGTLSSDAKSQQTRLATRRGIGTDLGSGLAYSLTHVNETLSLVGQSDSQVQADYRTQAQIDRLAHGGAINGVSADVLSQAQQEWITNNQDSIKNLPSELQYQALSQVTSYFGNMPSSGTSGTGVGGHDDNQFAKDVSFVGAAAQNGVDISSALQASVSRFGPQTSQFKNAAYQKGLTDLSNINDKFNLAGISTVGYMGNLAAPSQQAQYTMGLPITDVMKMATDYLNAPTNSTTFERRDGGTSRVLGKDAVLRQDIGTFQLNSLQAQGAGLTSSNISGILGNAGQYNTGLASDASKFQAALGQVPDQLALTNRLQTQYSQSQGVADLIANMGGGVSPFVAPSSEASAENYLTSTGIARVGMSKASLGKLAGQFVQAQSQGDIEQRAQALASEAGANPNDAQAMQKYRKQAADQLQREAQGGSSTAQSVQQTTEKGWAGSYNAAAGQGNQSYLSQSDFAGLRPQNAQALIGVGVQAGQQGASGLGVMSGALGFISDLFKQNTDASLKLGNQIQAQTQQASQMFQSYAAYGGATSQHMAQLQQIAMDPNAARAQANLAIGQGDPIAMSQFAAAHPGSPSFMQQLQVSGKKGTTIGAQAGYDEMPNADLQSALLTVDTKYGGFMQSDAKAAGFNMGSFNQMSMVQTQAAITGYQTQLFNMQNAAADTGLQRQRNLVTGQGAWTVGVGDDGKAANLSSSAGLDSTVDAITGKTLSSLIKGVSQWGLEDQGTILQRQQQDWSYQQQTAQLGINQSQFALQGTQFGENQAFQQQQNTFNWGVQQQQMELGRTQQVQQSQWQMQDLKFGAAKESVNFGWQMQDYDRQMRFARGQDKVDLERNRSRAVVSYAMDMGQTNTQEGRVTTQANQATQGYQLQVKSFNQQKQFTEESMQLDKKHFDQNRALQQQQMNLEVQDHQKQLQFLQEQRSQEDQSRALQRASFLVTQKDAENQQKVSEKAALALKALNDRMDDFSRRSTEAQQTSNYLAKIGGILDQINPKVTTFETDLQNAVVPMNNLVQSVRALINSLAAGANAENKATQAASNMQKLQAKTGAGAALGGVVNYPSMLNNYTPDLSPLTTSGSKYSPAGQITVHGGETIYPSGSSPNSGNPDDSANLEKIASGINQLVQQGTVRPSINVSSNNSRSGVAGALSAYDLMKGRFKQ